MPERTPLHPRHLALGARLVDFAGWEMPQQYSSVREEHLAVRRAGGLFDVSHMGRADIRGAAAFEFLQGLVTNDLARVAPRRAQYNLLCNEEGGVVDDLIVYRGEAGAEVEWRVVINASNREKDLDWLRAHAPAGLEIVDRSQETSLLAFQGPLAERLLPTRTDLAAVPAFGSIGAEVAGVPCTLSRTGYTGEDGFELFMAADRAAEVWDAILEAGREHGVLPCGLAARDVCRLEAGLRLYGNDMDDRTSPYEAGLGWTVKLDKGDFAGREALAELKQAGPSRELVGIRCPDRIIPRHDARVSRAGRPVGRVTSGTYSFFLQCGIGMASIAAGQAPKGTVLELEGRGAGGTAGSAEVVPLPFYRGSVKTAATGRAT